MNQQEYFLAHQVDGQLTEAQMAELLDLPEGDTSTTLDSGKPDAASEAADKPSPVENATPTSDEPGDGVNNEPEPVVLAKDGVHTIPYEKLVEAREGEKQWKAQAEAAQAELEDLRAAAQQRADAGQAPTATDNAVAAATAAIDSGIDPAIFGDFSDKDLAKGIAKLQELAMTPLLERIQKLEQLESKLTEVVQPIQAQQAKSAVEAHYQAIYAAHPDADSLVESKELADWIAKQPSFARAGYQAALTQGTTEQVIELFGAFKEATGSAKATAEVPDVASAAKAALAKAKPAVPSSLSEIPAGSAAPHDEATAMLEASSTAIMKKFDGKSWDYIEKLLCDAGL